MLLCFTIMNDISNFWFGGFPIKFLSIIKTETGSLCGNGTRTYHRFPMEKMVTGNCFLHAPDIYLSEGNLNPGVHVDLMLGELKSTIQNRVFWHDSIQQNRTHAALLEKRSFT